MTEGQRAFENRSNAWAGSNRTWEQLPQFLRDAWETKARMKAPYPFCRTPKECAGKGYCTKDPACNE